MDYIKLSKLEYTEKTEMLFEKLKSDEDATIDFIISNSDYPENEIRGMSEGDFEFHLKELINEKNGDELSDILMEHDY
jgi:hypothetical protein